MAMNKLILLSGMTVLALAFGMLFVGRYTQLYAVVYVDQVDPSRRVSPILYAVVSEKRFPTTERDQVFLDQKIAEVEALYPEPRYIVEGGWDEETVCPYAMVGGIVCLIGSVAVAISFALPSIGARFPDFRVQ